MKRKGDADASASAPGASTDGTSPTVKRNKGATSWVTMTFDQLMDQHNVHKQTLVEREERLKTCICAGNQDSLVTTKLDAATKFHSAAQQFLKLRAHIDERAHVIENHISAKFKTEHDLIYQQQLEIELLKQQLQHERHSQLRPRPRDEVLKDVHRLRLQLTFHMTKIDEMTSLELVVARDRTEKISQQGDSHMYASFRKQRKEVVQHIQRAEAEAEALNLLVRQLP